MARTAEGSILTEQHRSLQLTVRASALAELRVLWSNVDPVNLSSTISPFATAGAVVVRARRRQSEQVANGYFREFRRLEGVGGTVAVIGEARPPAETVRDALRGAALGGIIRARRRGFSPGAAAANGFVRAAGAATSLVLGGGRRLLIGAITADREALGWQRVTDGSPCAFCRMVASRGAVFKSEASADFEAHDHCGCGAEPFYDGSRPLPANERFRQEWDQATAGLSGREALNAFRRSLEQVAV